MLAGALSLASARQVNVTKCIPLSCSMSPGTQTKTNYNGLIKH